MARSPWRRRRPGIRALDPEHLEQFAFLQIPDSPVTPVQGWASAVAGNLKYARPALRWSRTGRPKAIKYVELGWLVQDANGFRSSTWRPPRTGGRSGDVPAAKPINRRTCCRTKRSIFRTTGSR